MTGDAEFNEVSSTTSRVPADTLVGAEDDGWRVCTAMLAHELLAATATGPTGRRDASWSQACDEAASSRSLERS